MSNNQQEFLTRAGEKDIFDSFIDRLEEAVRYPSVSSDPAHAKDVQDMASWLTRKLELFGVTIIPSPSEVPSLVLGHINGIEGSTKTVLIYGHYDVQPADEEGWKEHNPDSEKPFVPTRITNVQENIDKVVGRGTTDDKGPITGWLNVLEAHQKLQLPLPINVRFLFEGTEEVGNDAFEPWIIEEAKKPDGFFSDVSCVCLTDNYWFNYRHPTLSYGLRGVATFTIDITGAKDDLHSGIYGRMVHEPMTDLIKLLGKLVGANGVITVPEVEESVPPPTEEEKEKYRAFDYTVGDLVKDTGADVGLSEDPAELLMGRMRYPSLSIHNITGGRKGTIIPRAVQGSFSLRLVRPQKPEEIETLVKKYIHDEFKKLGSKNKIDVKLGVGALPWIGETDHWNFKAAYEATKRVYGADRAPYYTLEGGTIPLVSTLQESLPKEAPDKLINVLLLPMGRSDDGAHSLSEKIDIENYTKGTLVYGAYLYELAKQTTA